jgi:formylglycine-generating enzyme required for sulfatase activity
MLSFLAWGLLACVPDPVWVSGEPAEQVEIAATSFELGHPDAEPGDYGQRWKVNEMPAHTVSLGGFSMDATEVTVEAWAGFLNGVGGDVHHHPLQPVTWEDGSFVARADLPENTPIHYVSWHNAVAFCGWVGGRLPTEAMWELAAKGTGGDRRWPWGDTGPTCAEAVHFTNQTLCAGTPQPVGSRGEAGRSALGLDDMGGNVAEWVGDWYGDYEGSDSEGSEQVDPTGPEEGTWKVLRGGGFREGQKSIRVTARNMGPPETRSEGVGFRCARSL